MVCCYILGRFQVKLDVLDANHQSSSLVDSGGFMVCAYILGGVLLKLWIVGETKIKVGQL